MVIQIREKNRRPCKCGCGIEGVPASTGKGHASACKCRACIAGRNSRRGKRLHRAVANKIGASTGYGTSSHEESWVHEWRCEVKTGKQISPILTRYLDARSQSNSSRAIGDVRPFVFIADPGVKGQPTLAIIDLDDLMKMTGVGDDSYS